MLLKFLFISFFSQRQCFYLYNIWWSLYWLEWLFHRIEDITGRYIGKIYLILVLLLCFWILREALGCKWCVYWRTSITQLCGLYSPVQLQLLIGWYKQFFFVYINRSDVSTVWLVSDRLVIVVKDLWKLPHLLMLIKTDTLSSQKLVYCFFV